MGRRPGRARSEPVSAAGDAMEPGAAELYDQALLGILQHVGNVQDFLRVLFGFLYRKTDFYRLLRHPSDRMGFPPGAAQALVLQVARGGRRGGRPGGGSPRSRPRFPSGASPAPPPAAAPASSPGRRWARELLRAGAPRPARGGRVWAGAVAGGEAGGPAAARVRVASALGTGAGAGLAPEQVLPTERASSAEHRARRGRPLTGTRSPRSGR